MDERDKLKISSLSPVYSGKNLDVRWREVLSALTPISELFSNIVGSDTGKVMFINNNGHPCLTNEGHIILKYFNLGHRIAELLKNAAIQHHKNVGDNSKSFMILCVSSLRAVQNQVSIDQHMSQIQIIVALKWFLNHVFGSLKFMYWIQEISCATAIEFHPSKINIIKNEMMMLVSSMLKGKFSTSVISKMTELFTSFIWNQAKCMNNLKSTLANMLNRLDSCVIKVVGVPFSNSCLIEGLLFEKKSACESSTKISFPAHQKGIVLSSECNSFSTSSTEIQIRSEAEDLLWKSASAIKNWVLLLADNMITCVFCDGKLHSMLALYCERFDILIFDQLGVDCVTSICTNFSVHPVDSLNLDFQSDTFRVEISEFEFVNQQYFCLKKIPHSNDLQSILLCSLSEQLQQQYSTALCNLVVMLEQWIKTDVFPSEIGKEETLYSVDVWVFYMLLHCTLNDKQRLHSELFTNFDNEDWKKFKLSASIISNALVTLTKCSYENSYPGNRFLEELLKVEHFYRDKRKLSSNINYNSIISPFHSQYLLLQDFIKVLIQVLKIDQVF